MYEDEMNNGQQKSDYNQNNPYSQYSYGQQSSYGYNQNGQQPGYGTYQYNTSTGTMGAGYNATEAPVKKKHTGAKVVAILAAIALLAGGAGASYYAYSRNILPFMNKQEQTEAAAEEVETPAAITESASAQTESTEDTKSTESAAEASTEEKKVQATTTTAETIAVVTDVTAVVQEVMPAMVMIHNNYTASANYFGYITEQEATASGSGIIVGENETELLVATNYHVIEGADTLEVIFSDDSVAEAIVKGTDSNMDLAVIAVMLDDIDSDTLDEIKVATLGDSEALVLGEPAIAIGNALGYGQSVTTGVISAVNRSLEIEEGVFQEFIQTDAAINPGNSGGALLNLQGEVIGINSSKLADETIEGMGYAIPISVAKPIIDKLMNEETKTIVSSEERGYIGISGVSVTSDVSEVYGIPKGVYVAEVSPNGGAAQAGIQKGDVITEFDGNEITSMDDLQTRLQYYAAGTTVSITVMRQNGTVYSEKTFDVTLGYASGLGSGADSNAAEEGSENNTPGQHEGNQPGNKSGQSSGGH